MPGGCGSGVPAGSWRGFQNVAEDGSIEEPRGEKRPMELSREKARLVRRLRNPRFRPREGLFLVEGIRGVREVLEAPVPPEISFAMVSPRLRETDTGRELHGRLQEAALPLFEVTDREMEDLSDTERPQGALLVVVEPKGGLETLRSLPAPRLLVLDGIQDPGNGGTLIRAAWAFGADGVLALEGTVDPWGPKVVRAAAGALVHLPVFRAAWEEVAPWMLDRKIPVLASAAGGEDARTARPGPGWALVVGNEGAGIRKEVLATAAGILSIPMAPGVDSLNAGVAGAILLFTLMGAHDNKGGD